jgi:hypothetical protein
VEEGERVLGSGSLGMRMGKCVERRGHEGVEEGCVGEVEQCGEGNFSEVGIEEGGEVGRQALRKR